MLTKYNIIILKYIYIILILITFSFPANSDSSIEEIIKGRKTLFSKNYSTAKKVQTFIVKDDLKKAKSLMIEMSENYKNLIPLFPKNTITGFKTEALPTIWENKKEFNNLMKKSSDDMIKLASIIETTDDVTGALNKMMWSNCKACHSRFRAPH
jgi:cytochrome c556